MKKRIYGLETEYGIIDFLDTQETYEISALGLFFEIIFEKISGLERIAPRRAFYPNGSLIYLEQSFHPEYASPECASIRDLVKWDKAGERIFEEAMDEVNRILAEQGRLSLQVRLFKNNVDGSGSVTFGCHENYLVERRVNEDYLNVHLLPFLISRPIICGSGTIEENGFQISQRASFIQTVTNLTSTNERPILHSKDETLASPLKWRRLHLIIGDANMSEVSTFLKVGATALVLRMIEDGFLPLMSNFRPVNPVGALREVSRDIGLRKKIYLEKESGDYPPDATAIEIQEWYLARAKEYLDEQRSVEAEWEEVARKWEYVLDCLKEDPMRLCREVDWVAKKWLMESLLSRQGWDWGKFRDKIGTEEAMALFKLLKTVDLQYHDIRRDTGLYYLLEKEGIMERLINEEEIEQAKTEPPPDTRAKWRTDFMKLVKEDEQLQKLRCQVADWDKITLTGPPEESVRTTPVTAEFFYRPTSANNFRAFTRDDPFDNSPPDLEEILVKMRLKRE